MEPLEVAGSGSQDGLKDEAVGELLFKLHLQKGVVATAEQLGSVGEAALTASGELIEELVDLLLGEGLATEGGRDSSL